MRSCVWFCFGFLTVKLRWWCLALKQNSPLSSLCPVSGQLDAGISPDSVPAGRQFFPTVFTTEPCKSCAWCTAGFAVAAEQWVMWCGVAATFGKVVVKDKKPSWFVPIWTGERRLWWDPKTLLGLQGCQDQTFQLIIRCWNTWYHATKNVWHFLP